MTSIQTYAASVAQLTTPPLPSQVETKDDDVSRRKRSVEDFTEGSEVDSQAIKRAKTDFSGHLYSRLVKSALDSLDQGDSSAIDALTSQISLPSSNPESLTTKSMATILHLLSQEVSRLDGKSTISLIRAILKYDWLAHSDDDELVFNYSTFLTVLVSGIPKWFNDVTAKLISDFTRKPDAELQHLHKTLGYVIQISPTSFNALPVILRDSFPNKTASKEELVNYTRNLLALLSYCDDLRYAVWSLIVEKLIKLDVELQNEIDDVDDDDLNDALDGAGDENGKSGDGDISLLSEKSIAGDQDDEGYETEVERGSPDEKKNDDYSDGEDDEDDEDGFLDEDDNYDVEIRNITDLSGKLDCVMKLIFEATENSFTTEGLEGGNGVNLFSTLTSIFRTYVLPTHYTRCVQYLMFHMVQQQPDLTDSFLVMLLDVVFNSNEITANRIKAMQYVSSFMARAKSLSKSQLLPVIKYLMAWANEYVTEREKEVGDGHGGMERFMMLYCVLQGLMYIFCFRYKDLKREDNDEEWELRLDKFFNKVIMSKFNPLKYCNETVVLIFARIVQRVDLCYCFSIIERNKRERLNGVRNAVASADSSETRFESKQEFLDLEAYFPFDPLMLTHSKKIVNTNYIEWQSLDDSEDSD
ncbi:DEKNAAC104653 [Brettanomyces naardenensis]|uniref:DEKNAAC104653 n=1 Tax=Brettanomyces naardenensis TaxID=13370 RepID=A0A448YR97_BRENA|nr:DEKNAAC104653 [Brettanomyces naardenensis]